MLLGFALCRDARSDVIASVADERAGSCASFEGAAFVFCVAFCDARACDHRAPGDRRCIALRRGFSRASGGAAPPCGDGVLASTLE